MGRNSITAPLHTAMQVQSSVCSMITFCIICDSHSSVDENSSLLVYCTKLSGKILLMFQTSMLPPSKGKGVFVQVINKHGELEVSPHKSRTSLPEEAWWLSLCPGIFNPGERDPQHLLEMWLGASQNQWRHFGKR